MAQESFTKKLIKLAKDLDKLHQMVDNTIKDVKTLIPEVKPPNDEGKGTDKQE
jgi:signal transduction histidine kinase